MNVESDTLINRSPLLRLCGFTGRRSIALLIYLVDTTSFMFDALLQWARRSRLINRASYRSLVTQLLFTGVDALPIVGILALASGLGITSQLLMQVDVIGSRTEVMQMLVQVVALELGSLLTAILLIGRSGSAITVDMGNMKLHREIEALELLGIHLGHFFVAPRILGTAIAQLCLSVYFSTIAVVGGIVYAGLFISPGYFSYLTELPLSFEPYDMLTFVIKNLLFGLIIGTIGCFHGLRVGDSPSELPQQTQQAIVNSIVLVFIIDGLIIVGLQ